MSLSPPVKGSVLIGIIAIALAVVGIATPAPAKKVIIASGVGTSFSISNGSQCSSGNNVYTGPPTPVGILTSVKAFTLQVGESVTIATVIAGQVAQIKVCRNATLVDDTAACFSIYDPINGGYEWDGATPCYYLGYAAADTVTVNWIITN